MNADWTTLNSLAVGETATVEAIDAGTRARRRLVEMGVTPGARLRVSRRAPLGDPLEIRLRGCALTLRAQDARQIFVKREARP